MIAIWTDERDNKVDDNNDSIFQSISLQLARINPTTQIRWSSLALRRFFVQYKYEKDDNKHKFGKPGAQLADPDLIIPVLCFALKV
jgi:hypothetical protein